jgi:hypothetical protein
LHVRIAAAQALAEMLDEPTATQLVTQDLALAVDPKADDTDKNFRRVKMALRCLGRAHFGKAETRSREILLVKDGNPVIRASALFAVCEINRPDPLNRQWSDPKWEPTTREAFGFVTQGNPSQLQIGRASCGERVSVQV